MHVAGFWKQANLLNVGHIVDTADERSRAAKEGVWASGIHHGMPLSLLDRRPSEHDVSWALL